MVVLTPCAEARLVTSLSVESFGKMIVEKRVELACVLPKTDKLLSLLTVCSSLYSPTIRYTPLAGWTVNCLTFPSFSCSVNVEYSIVGVC